MTSEEVFLQAICEDPDDDTHRLIYADWLEDRGDTPGRDRAEFIRLQMELNEPAPPTEHRLKLEARCFDLLAQYERHWVRQDLRGLVQRGRFRRGFVEEVTLNAGTFVNHSDQLLQSAPIRFVHLRGAASQVKAIRSLQALQRLRGLGFRNNLLDDSHLNVLLESPYLDRLEWLDLANNEIRLGQPAPFRASSLARLGSLNLSLNRVRPEALGLIAGLPALRSLGLEGNYVGDAGIRHLCAETNSRTYQALNLGNNRITMAGVRQLALWPSAQALTALQMDWNPLGNAGVQALAESPHLTALEELNLSYTETGQAGLDTLNNSPLRKRLRTLILAGLPQSGSSSHLGGRAWEGMVLE